MISRIRLRRQKVLKDPSRKDSGRAWLEAYKEISRLTGIALKDTVDRCYCLVIDRNHDLFREVGLYSHSDFSSSRMQFYQFKGRKLVEFNRDQISEAVNVLMLLEERDDLKKIRLLLILENRENCSSIGSCISLAFLLFLSV